MRARIKKFLLLLGLSTVVGLIFIYFERNSDTFKELEKYVAQDASVVNEVGRVSSAYPRKVRSFGASTTGVSEKTWYSVTIYGEHGSTIRELWVYKDGKKKIHVSREEPLPIPTSYPIK